MERFGHIVDDRLRDLCAYWLELRRGRLAPSRADVDLAAIPRLMPYLWIYDVVPPRKLRFRLAGEHINQMLGCEAVGKLLDEIFEPAKAAEVTARLMSCIDGLRASHTIGTATLASGETFEVERITLPLMTAAPIPDGLIGATIYNGGHVGVLRHSFVRENLTTTYTALRSILW